MSDGRADSEASFVLLVSLAWSDGRLDPRERKQLEAVGRRLGLDPARIAELVAEGERSVTRPLPPPPATEAERVRSFLELVRLVMADGEVAEPERAFLHRVAAHYGIPAQKVQSILAS